MATHSSIIFWEIPWTEESSGLQSMGLRKNQTRFSHQTSQKLDLFTTLYHLFQEEFYIYKNKNFLEALNLRRNLSHGNSQEIS